MLQVEAMWKFFAALIVAFVTCMQANAADSPSDYSANATSVLTVTSLRIQGQPAVLQEEAGDCIFFGKLAGSGNVKIDIKVCKRDDGDGSLFAEYYPAIAYVDTLPVLEGIRLDLHLHEDRNLR